jgi:predicted DNA-binding ribbon-helix-helix protein
MTKEFKKRNRKRSAEWQGRRTNIVLEFLRYCEFKKIKRLKDISESLYSAHVNNLNRKCLKKSTIERYKNIIKTDLLSHFRPIK